MRSAKCWASSLTACTLVLSISLVGCGKDKAPEQGKAPAAAPQAMPVGVIVAQPQSVERTVELSGRTAAYQISEVRPQTSGVILKRLFTEGSYVRAGQALYEIDDRTNRATVETAKASLLRQEANLQALRTKEGRYRQLVHSNAISKQEYDDILAQVKLAEADVAATKASLQNAQINLDYSTVRSPISGQSSRSSVTAGALVTANQAAPLVTIQQLNPIYVDINQSSTEMLRLRQQLSQGKLNQSNNTKVKLKLEDGSIYPIEGKLAFSDASVDPNTGSVTLRAVFDNPNHLLLPGMFANAQIVQGRIPNAYLVPQAAVTRTPTGQAMVMLANSEGKVEPRPVTTVGVQGTNWIITEGLQTGDKVIVDGIAKVKEGQPVQANPINVDAQAAPQSAPPTATPVTEAAQPTEPQGQSEQPAKEEASAQPTATSNT